MKNSDHATQTPPALSLDSTLAVWGCFIFSLFRHTRVHFLPRLAIFLSCLFICPILSPPHISRYFDASVWFFFWILFFSFRTPFHHTSSSYSIHICGPFLTALFTLNTLLSRSALCMGCLFVPIATLLFSDALSRHTWIHFPYPVIFSIKPFI